MLVTKQEAAGAGADFAHASGAGFGARAESVAENPACEIDLGADFLG